MAKAFTLDAYREILHAYKFSGIPILPVIDYFLQRNMKEEFIVLRHDVDRRPKNALRMAEIEHEMGIQSTYYFRVPFDRNIVSAIAMMSHEIGYHYEVIDKAKGDLSYAKQIFSRELDFLRAYAPINTCSPHGNPLTKWDNKIDIDILDLFADASQISFGFYYTDTGRGKADMNIKDFIRRGDNLVSCVNFHPERWNDGLGWYRQWLFDFVCNCCKKLIKGRNGRHGNLNRKTI